MLFTFSLLLPLSFLLVFSSPFTSPFPFPQFYFLPCFFVPFCFPVSFFLLLLFFPYFLSAPLLPHPTFHPSLLFFPLLIVPFLSPTPFSLSPSLISPPFIFLLCCLAAPRRPPPFTAPCHALSPGSLCRQGLCCMEGLPLVSAAFYECLFIIIFLIHVADSHVNFGPSLIYILVALLFDLLWPPLLLAFHSKPSTRSYSGCLVAFRIYNCVLRFVK